MEKRRSGGAEIAAELDNAANRIWEGATGNASRATLAVIAPSTTAVRGSPRSTNSLPSVRSWSRTIKSPPSLYGLDRGLRAQITIGVDVKPIRRSTR